MKKLMLALIVSFTANAVMAEELNYVGIGNLFYELDTIAKTAAIDGCGDVDGMTFIDVREVEYEGEIYTVTTVLEDACKNCSALTSISLPNVTTVEENAFGECHSLISVSLPKAKSIGARAFRKCFSLISISLPKAISIGHDALVGCDELESLVLGWELLPKAASLGLPESVKIVPPLPKQMIECGSYNVVVECGDEFLSPPDYAKACGYYGIIPKPAPQIVQEGEVVIAKESIAAAKAEAVSIVGGVVTLNVGVSSNGNFTVETANWEKARIMDAKLNDDGTVKLTVPTSSSSGFMILRSEDAHATANRAAVAPGGQVHEE